MPVSMELSVAGRGLDLVQPRVPAVPVVVALVRQDAEGHAVVGAAGGVAGRAAMALKWPTSAATLEAGFGAG